MNENTPPKPKNPGTIIGFIYATTNDGGQVDLEIGHAFPAEPIARRKLFQAMVDGLKKEMDKS